MVHILDLNCRLQCYNPKRNLIALYLTDNFDPHVHFC